LRYQKFALNVACVIGVARGQRGHAVPKILENSQNFGKQSWRFSKQYKCYSPKIKHFGQPCCALRGVFPNNLSVIRLKSNNQTLPNFWAG